MLGLVQGPLGAGPWRLPLRLALEHLWLSAGMGPQVCANSLPPFYRQKNWGIERPVDLLKSHKVIQRKQSDWILGPILWFSWWYHRVTPTLAKQWRLHAWGQWRCHWPLGSSAWKRRQRLDSNPSVLLEWTPRIYFLFHSIFFYKSFFSFWKRKKACTGRISLKPLSQKKCYLHKNDYRCHNHARGLAASCAKHQISRPPWRVPVNWGTQGLGFAPWCHPVFRVASQPERCWLLFFNPVLQLLFSECPPCPGKASRIWGCSRTCQIQIQNVRWTLNFRQMTNAFLVSVCPIRCWGTYLD